MTLKTHAHVLTRHTQAPIAGTDAAADAVSAWIECAEVYQLGAGGSSETSGTGAAEGQTSALWETAAVIVTGPRSTGVDFLLTHGTLIT